MTTPTAPDSELLEKLRETANAWKHYGAPDVINEPACITMFSRAADLIEQRNRELADEKRTSESWKLRHDRKCEELAARSKGIEIIERQASDEGLWFDATTAPEAYLQSALRNLHTFVEAQAKELAAARALALIKESTKENGNG